MNTALQISKQTLPVVSDGLSFYLQQINAVPYLTEEEEFALAKRYRQEGDLMAAQQLVMSHLRYVARIARQFNGYGLATSDLIQEGTIGLMKAVKRFDPEMGVRLVSFAVHWIKSEIHDFVIRNWRIVKVATTKAQRKLFFNLRKSKQRLGWFSQQEIEEVAQDLGVTTADVVEMEKRLSGYDTSFDAPEESEETAYLSPIHHLEAPKTDEPTEVISFNWKDAAQRKLSNALANLDPRSSEIIFKRWLTEPKTSLQTLAEQYGVSIERVRQIEKAALVKMRAAIPSLEAQD